MEEYTIIIALVQLLSAVVLFFIVNWIGSKSISIGYIQLSTSFTEDTYPAFNFLFKVIAPPVFLVLYSTFCQLLNADCLNTLCYLLVVYYWLFRALFIVITGKSRLENWSVYTIYSVCSIGISVGVYSLINNVEKILPDPRDLLNQLWLLIIIFLYNIFNNMVIGREKTIRRKESYISQQYRKFNKKYGRVVRDKCHNEFLEAVTFSIMIYENFNRPTIVRWVEYLRFWITRREHTLGIMQVKTPKYITDLESIELAIERIKKSVSKINSDSNVGSEFSCYTALDAITFEYNGGSANYDGETSDIFKYLITNYYKNAEVDCVRIIPQGENPSC
ncbi:MAG: hypothetical protein IJ524_05465 [Bacteroidales bacterium]|nr:hypothetical protein [Bacteroidales bacterium]